MCGILGSIDLPISELALDSISHRGPDDHGNRCFRLEDRAVHLAQRRLAILDLSPAGHQPMVSNEHETAIIFNGEVYNHLELRNRLSKKYLFKGHSDTETLLYYLSEFGIEGVRDFNGIFSLAFFSRKTHQLYLVRDRYGVKPLYYWLHEEGPVLFSSELRAIRTLAHTDQMDMEALATLLRLRYNPAPDTLFQSIKKIYPGHYLQIDLRSKKLQCHVQKYCHQRLRRKKRQTDRTYLAEYGAKIEAAVHRQLLSDVEVGLLLSGGVDSAVVAALAQRHSDQKLKAFTIGFEGSYEEDEIAAAEQTAAILGLEHHITRISFPDFLNQIKICTNIVEEPLATTSMIPMYYLAKLASQYVKVVLTGQGADEPLGGYTRYKGELLQQKLPSYLKPLIPALLSWTGRKDDRLQRGMNLLAADDEPSRFLAAYQVFSPSEIHALIGAEEDQALARIKYYHNDLECEVGVDSVERMMAIDTRLNLADDLLNYTDKITMHFSLECRVPMLDVELVQFVESLPRSLKLNLRSGKIIHKQYAGKILGSEIVHRKKKAFQSPTRRWFRTEMDQIADILLSSHSHFSSVFDQKAVAAILKTHMEGFNREKQIFLLLSIYYWMEALSTDRSRFSTDLV